jgi:hypothetical protein
VSSIGKFSITDFLAYLFPGAGLLVALLLITNSFVPVEKVFAPFWSSLAGGALGIALSYVLGTICSSVVQVSGIKERAVKGEVIGNNPNLQSRISQIEEAFSNVFNPTKDWTKSEFYAMRVAVHCVDPNLSSIIQRQNSLRQIRQNSVLPVIVWGFFGALKGLQKGDWLGYSLGSASIILSVLLVLALRRAAGRNRQFEVRDCGLAFLTLYKLGKFEKGAMGLNSAQGENMDSGGVPT